MTSIAIFLIHEAKIEKYYLYSKKKTIIILQFYL